jgi:sugar (pentulose or hexulose) kinase
VGERGIIVIDIGKTHAKLTLWDGAGALLAVRKRPNARLDGVLDVIGIENWIALNFTELSGLADVGAIIPVAHGAAAVLIRDGSMVCPLRDYEAPIAPDVRAAYDALRPPFAETGSPALTGGLNLGAQLFAQLNGHASPAMTVDTILLWPQYWSWLLSGIASSEVTSLGCHTDLWNPAEANFSRLAVAMGWAKRFPPLRRAGDILGPITPEWAARTGLPADTNIYCGVHDSNAALVAARGFAEIAGQEATVLSTGTWFIALRSTAATVDFSAIPEARDCLINVDVEGRSVPSVRFMGGRELEALGVMIDQPGLDGLAEVVASGAMILPTFAPGCGPFPQGQGRWLREPTSADQRRAAAALYTALVTDASLDLIGARDTLLIEGRFAQSEAFTRALATLRPETAVYTSAAEADVSFGALRLINPAISPPGKLARVAPLDDDLSGYKTKWHQRIEQGDAA